MKGDNAVLLTIAIIVFLGASGVLKGVTKSNSRTTSGGILSNPYSTKTTNQILTRSTRQSATDLEESIEQTKRDLALAEAEKNASVYKDKVFIDRLDPDGAFGADPFLILEASRYNKENVIITGWQIKSTVSGNIAVIGGASQLPQLSGNTETPISLVPGDSAFIYREASPIGASFLTNLCTGYFNERRIFTPELENDCPLADEENLPSSVRRDEDCMDDLNSVGRCEQLEGSVPEDISHSCSNFAEEFFTYDNCVSLHRNEPGFLKPEWRVFLGIRKQIWSKDSEIIQILDQYGKVVDVANY